jgi:hypothetical protein
MTSRLLAQVHNVNVSVRQSFRDSRQEREVRHGRRHYAMNGRPLQETKACMKVQLQRFFRDDAKIPSQGGDVEE